jgi:hypothetical protein
MSTGENAPKPEVNVSSIFNFIYEFRGNSEAVRDGVDRLIAQGTSLPLVGELNRRIVELRGGSIILCDATFFRGSGDKWVVGSALGAWADAIDDAMVSLDKLIPEGSVSLGFTAGITGRAANAPAFVLPREDRIANPDVSSATTDAIDSLAGQILDASYDDVEALCGGFQERGEAVLTHLAHGVTFHGRSKPAIQQYFPAN